MNDEMVELYLIGSWYKVYGDGAKIISFLMDYKLFEDAKTGVPSVGFPETSIVKVLGILSENKINYVLSNEDNQVKDFGSENNFKRFVKNDLPYTYISTHGINEKKYSGSFTVKYNNEEPEEFIINENIDPDAALVKKVVDVEPNTRFELNGYNILLIEKNLY